MSIYQKWQIGAIEKWHIPLKYSKILGAEQERTNALYKKADVYIINRENLKWLVDNHKFDFDMVVLDELSSFKSAKSARFKAMRKVRPFVKRIVGLTGTPAPNGLLDLWSQVALLDMGKRLGRFLTRYREQYFLPDKRNGQIIYSWKLRDNAESQIYQAIDDICISMKACDYLKLPERVDNVVEVEMTQKDTELYEELKREMLLQLPKGDIDAKTAAVLSNKLRQMASGTVYDENGAPITIHEQKLNALEDLIEEANGKSVLVFYEFRSDLEKIKVKFGAKEIKNEKDVNDWNNGKIPLAICHPASCGHGLNLQDGGCTLVWYTLPWSLELYQQANARLHRQGQKNTVIIHHLMTKSTIDSQVMKNLANKTTTQENLIAAVKAELVENPMIFDTNLRGLNPRVSEV